MNKLHLICAAALLGAGAPAFAADSKMMMDSNQDGMVSKDEYMKHHEAMFTSMDKSGKGMVPVADMERSMRVQSMRSDKASQDEKAKMDDRARKGQAPAPPAQK